MIIEGFDGRKSRAWNAFRFWLRRAEHAYVPVSGPRLMSSSCPCDIRNRLARALRGSFVNLVYALKLLIYPLYRRVHTIHRIAFLIYAYLNTNNIVSDPG